MSKELQVDFVGNRNIQGFNLFKDDLYLLDSGKRLLANTFTTNFSNILLIMQLSNKFA